MKKFAAGFATGVAVTVLGVIAIAFWWTSPSLDITVATPASTELYRAFSMNIIAHNPHSETVTLGNVDIPNAFLESFEVVSVTPTPTEESPLGGFGTQTWYFDLEMPPTSTKTITFEIRPIAPGHHVIEFEVCNSTEDCVPVAKAIDIQ